MMIVGARRLVDAPSAASGSAYEKLIKPAHAPKAPTIVTASRSTYGSSAGRPPRHIPLSEHRHLPLTFTCLEFNADLKKTISSWRKSRRRRRVTATSEWRVLYQRYLAPRPSPRWLVA